MLKLAIVTLLIFTGLTICATTLRAQETHTVSGEITDHLGNALPDVIVHACVSNGCPGYALSDDSGSFTLRLPAGNYHININAGMGLRGSFAYDAPGRFTLDSRERTAFPVTGEDTAPLLITLPETRSISGVVVNDDQSPAEGVLLRVKLAEGISSWIGAVTNAVGQFEIRLPDGSYWLGLQTPDGYSTDFIDLTNGSYGSVWPRPVTLVSGHDLTGIRVTLPEKIQFSVSIDAPTATQLVVYVCPFGDHVWPPRTANLGIRCPVRRVIPGDEPHADIELTVDEDSRNARYNLTVYLEDAGEQWHYRRVWHYTGDGEPSVNPADRASLSLQDLDGADIDIVVPRPPTDYAVTMDLLPGANLIGWTGAATSIASLCDDPRIQAVLLLARDGKWANGTICLLERSVASAGTIQTGELAYIWLSPGDPYQLRLTTARPQWRQTLQAGRSFATWLGPDDTPLSEATRSLGADAEVFVVDTSNQDSESSLAAVLRHGDVVLVELTRETTWLVSPRAQPEYLQIGSEEQSGRSDLVEEIKQVQQFFWDRFSVLASDFSVLYTRDWESAVGFEPFASSSNEYEMDLVSLSAIAHEYVHVLQSHLSNFQLISLPLWTYEGPATYLDSIYHGNWSRTSTDTQSVRENMIRRLEGITVRLAETFEGPERNLAYSLGALASEYLDEHHGGTDALLDFWRTLAVSSDWITAFKRTFGISVDDFYERFAEYRANGFELDDG